MELQQRELRRQLDWLMTFRVVIITTLMASTFVIELMYRPLLSLQSFYLLAVVTYAMTIAYAVMSRTLRAVRPQVYAQMIGDLWVVSGFVYLTGGAESLRHVLWCDIHPEVKGEVYVIETRGELGGG